MLVTDIPALVADMIEGVKQGKGYKITVDGNVTEFNPTNGFYDMDKVRKACNFSYFEIVHMADRNSIFLCDEEGLIYGKPVNVIASYMVQKSYKTHEVGIVGDCVFCHTDAVK